MEVVLKQDASNLGYAGDLVKVKAGYALNYLIPKGIAVLATESNKKVIHENQKQAAHKLAKIKAEAEARVNALKQIDLKLPVKVGTSGKIFGSITNLQISRQLKEQGFEIDRKDITVLEEMNKLGKYLIRVKLQKDISAEITLNVVREEDVEKENE